MYYSDPFKDIFERPKELREGFIFDEVHWIRQGLHNCSFLLSEAGESLQKEIDRLHRFRAELKAEKTKKKIQHQYFLGSYRFYYKLMNFGENDEEEQDLDENAIDAWEGSLLFPIGEIASRERDVKKEIQSLEEKLEQIEEIDEEIQNMGEDLFQCTSRCFDTSNLSKEESSEWIEYSEGHDMLMKKAENVIESCRELKDQTPNLEDKMKVWEECLAEWIHNSKRYIIATPRYDAWETDWLLPKRLKNVDLQNLQLEEKNKELENTLEKMKKEFEWKLQQNNKILLDTEEKYKSLLKENNKHRDEAIQKHEEIRKQGEEREKLLLKETEKYRAEAGQQNEKIRKQEDLLNQNTALLSNQDQETAKLKQYLEQVEERFEQRIMKKSLQIEELERDLKEVLNKIGEPKNHEDLKVKEEDGLEVERDNDKDTSSLEERDVEAPQDLGNNDKPIEKNFENSEASNTEGNYMTKEALGETLKNVQSLLHEDTKWNVFDKQSEKQFDKDDPKLVKLDLNLENEKENNGVKTLKKKQPSRKVKRNLDDLLVDSENSVETKPTSKAKPSRRNSKKEKVNAEGLQEKDVNIKEAPDKSESIEVDKVVKKIKQD